MEKRSLKQQYNFRLDKELMSFVEKKVKKSDKTLTHYVERALRKYSNFKEKELV